MQHTVIHAVGAPLSCTHIAVRITQNYKTIKNESVKNKAKFSKSVLNNRASDYFKINGF